MKQQKNMKIRNLESIWAHGQILKKAKIKLTSDCYLGICKIDSEQFVLQILWLHQKSHTSHNMFSIWLLEKAKRTIIPCLLFWYTL